MKVRNTFIIFILSGFWHGANWTYLAWGALNAFYILPLLLAKKNRTNLETVAAGKRFPSVKELFMMLTTFTLTVFAWIFFRAENIGQAADIMAEIFSASLFTVPSFEGIHKAMPTFILLVIFILTEWKGREQQFAIQQLGASRGRTYRWSYYIVILLSIYLFGNFGSNIEFIYFQF